jgi:aspartyl/asparaginyl beta-hydroxylase (cupin superfamily)
MLDGVIGASLDSLGTEPVRALADGVLAELDPGCDDPLAVFVERFSVRAFLTLMGLPLDDEAEVAALSLGIFSLDGVPGAEDERLAAGRRITAYFERVVDGWVTPSPGLVGQLISADVDGQPLSRAEVLSSSYLLLLAGIRTVSDALAGVLPYLIEHPDAWDELITAPDREHRRAIDELLRWSSPVPGLSRVLLDDLVVGDQQLEAGTRVVCLLPSANRDASVFDAPDEVRLDRSPNPHLTFGGGAHRCLGAPVAYVELRVALTALHAIPSLRCLREDDPMPTDPVPSPEEERPVPVAADTPSASVLNRSVSRRGGGRRQALVARLLTWNEASLDRAMPKPAGALSVDEFPWMKRLEEHWELIAEELDELIAGGIAFPEVSDLAGFDQGNEGSWSTYSLFTYGTWLPRHIERCPKTTALVREVPGLQIAGFSVLGPHSHLPRHRGPNRGALRYQIGLRMLGDPGTSRLQVGDQVIPWSQGASLVFDHSVEHEAWNDSDGSRYLLFIEFVWPRAGRVGLVNRAVQRLFGRAARSLATRATELDSQLNPSESVAGSPS